MGKTSNSNFELVDCVIQGNFMWWIIWGIVTFLGFLLIYNEALGFLGYIMRYIGIAGLIILAINWLNSTNRGDK